MLRNKKALVEEAKRILEEIFLSFYSIIIYIRGKEG